MIRCAQHDDIPQLLALWAAGAENDSRPTDTPEMVSALLNRDPDSCFVAVIEGQIVGSIIAGWDGWRAHLYRWAVHPDVRRQGVGSALLAAAEDRLAALGAGRFDAMVLEGNDLGQSVWRSAGYRSQPKWRRWVRPAD